MVTCRTQQVDSKVAELRLGGRWHAKTAPCVAALSAGHAVAGQQIYKAADPSPSSSCECALYLIQQGSSCHRQVEFKNGPPVAEACRAQLCRSTEAYTSVA